MDAVNDPRVREVVVMKSAQVGWTEILGNVVGYYVDRDPAPMLLIQPTLEMAEAWSKDRLAPMLRDTPALRGRIKDARARDSNNTLLHKTFPGGHITMAGANSPASLASRPIRIVLCDEVDRYPPSAGTEGDPVSLARKRSTTFWNRKLLMGSTPTIKDASRIEAAYEVSDQRVYEVPCPHCEAFNRLVWANVRWPEGDPLRACYVCPDCGVELTDADKARMLAKGRWRATATSNGIAGFHLSELYSPWVTFGQMADAFLTAKRSPETLKTWVNTSLGETWRENRDEGVESSSLMQRAEGYPLREPPAGVAVLTVGVDVQKDRFEVHAVGWGSGEEAWTVDYEAIYANPATDDAWSLLDEYLQREFIRSDGVPLRIAAAAIDSGGLYTQETYRFVRSRAARRVIAVKGQSQMGKPVIGKPVLVDVDYRGQKIKGGAQLWPVGADTAKGTLYGRFALDTPGPGYWHFSRELQPDFYEQITAERIRTRFVRGQAVVEWVKDAGARNEALDTAVYALAAAHMIGVNRMRPAEWEALQAQLADSMADSPKAAQVAPQARRVRMISQGMR